MPELYKKFSYIKTSIIISIVWNVYHYPVLLFSDYNNGISKISSIICFTISVTAICFITTWLRIKSQSMWPALILHATHNYFIQGLFDVITIDKGYTKIFTTEFGIGLAILYTFVGIYFLRKRFVLKEVG